MSFDAADDFDTTVRDAVTAHHDTVDTTVPDFATLLAARQRAVRRNVALSTFAIGVLGVGGLVVAGNAESDATSWVGSVATSRDEFDVEPNDTLVTTTTTSASAADPDRPTDSVSVQPAEDAQWFCRDRLGGDDQGRELYASCEPSNGVDDSEWACTDRLGTDDVGRIRFARCEPVGQLGPLPQAPGTPDEVGPDSLQRYTVEAGDYAIRVAVANCTTVDALETANGWSDSSLEFPPPGAEIIVPTRPDDATCESTRHVVEPGDYPIGIAEQYCVTLQDLARANDNIEGYQTFVPGLEIVIPPTVTESC